MTSSTTPKPASPPPAYAELDPSQRSPSSSHPTQPTHTSHTNSPLLSPFPRHPHYGPTPILSQQTQVLPYYDPRSQYAVAEANSRARWRFIGALFWALVIMGCLSLIMGMEAEIQRRPWRGGGWWSGRNNDPWENQ